MPASSKYSLIFFSYFHSFFWRKKNIVNCLEKTGKKMNKRSRMIVSTFSMFSHHLKTFRLIVYFPPLSIFVDVFSMFLSFSNKTRVIFHLNCSLFMNFSLKRIRKNMRKILRINNKILKKNLNVRQKMRK